MNKFLVVVVALGLYFNGFAYANDMTTSSQAKSLADEVQALKDKALQLEQALTQLEEELLFPDNTRVSVFLSLGEIKGFTLDAVDLLLDDKKVSSFLYGERKMDALKQGGIQRLYMGNIKNGNHKLDISFVGRGSKGQKYQQTNSYSFKKSKGPKYIELSIISPEKNINPEFSMNEWD